MIGATSAHTPQHVPSPGRVMYVLTAAVATGSATALMAATLFSTGPKRPLEHLISVDHGPDKTPQNSVHT